MAPLEGKNGGSLWVKGIEEDLWVGGGFGTFSRHIMSVFVFWFLQMHFCSGLRRRKLGCTSV
ncbi:hypothetical protein MYCTH_2313647, partial [Thermothelomyces thermophilus ATCC 42464]